MLLLISDANIIIDLEAGEIVETLFKLPYRFAIPDLLYAEEIAAASPYLVELGLQTLVVSGEYIEYAIRLGEQYGEEPGFNDRLALALAKQESCPLLTGDGNLRVLAAKEGADVRGTLWLFSEMIQFGGLTQDEAMMALRMMRRRGRRLPWQEAEKTIRRAVYDTKQSTPIWH
jgi:predicted nucleic acid-binding protein